MKRGVFLFTGLTSSEISIRFTGGLSTVKPLDESTVKRNFNSNKICNFYLSFSIHWIPSTSGRFVGIYQ